MPIYEYRCNACGHELEALQKLSDPALTDCPECGKPELKKQLSAAGFRLKGGGWYETDFKGGSKKNLHDTAKKESSSSSDTKPTGGCSGGGCACP
jgi:putative FmdB family regulatory protein